MPNAALSVVPAEGHALIGTLPLCMFSADLLASSPPPSSESLKSYRIGDITCNSCKRTAAELLQKLKAAGVTTAA